MCGIKESLLLCCAVGYSTVFRYAVQLGKIQFIGGVCSLVYCSWLTYCCGFQNSRAQFIGGVGS